MAAGSDWTRYKVGIASDNPKWINPDCQLLSQVYHVAHLDVALQICQATTIRARLISDRSILRDQRILVIWLSPNDWSNAGGFRYGNVRFAYEWKHLIEGKRYYQIEEIDYGIPALRILVTSKNYDDKFLKYDPTAMLGPWGHDVVSDKHYWNGNICLEVMLEDDLLINSATSMDFVQHHSHRCSVSPTSCPTRGLTGPKAGGRFVAALAGYEVPIEALPLRRTKDDGIHPTRALGIACDDLWTRLERLDVGWTGNLTGDSDLAVPVGRAILAAYARRNRDELCKLASLFRDSSECLGAVARVVASTFELPDWKILTSDYWESWHKFGE